MPTKKAILNIASTFCTSQIYSRLISSLLDLNIKTVNYIPLNHKGDCKNFIDTKTSNIYVVRKILNNFMRVFYLIKIIYIYIDIYRSIDLLNVYLIHAHTLYSDGGVAFLLKIFHKKEYIVAIRNTDLNFHAKYRPHLFWFRNLILSNAGSIVLISASYEHRLRKLVGEKFWIKIQGKIKIIPNGVHNDFFKTKATSASHEKMYSILFVGELNKNKNIIGLIEAVKKAKKSEESIELSVVGNGLLKSDLIKLIKKPEYSFCKYYGHVNDRKSLIDIYNKHSILAIPSLTETFGLVYIEALTQGLKVIHSTGEGVDGYFNNSNIVLSVDPRDVKDIERALLQLIDKQPTNFIDEKILSLDRFRWDVIAKQYASLYECIGINKEKV
jgi:L-malate glycosyltransferase